MKQITTILVLLLSFFSAHAQTDTLWLSNAYTTHIIFSTDVTYADLSNNRIVAAKIVEQNRNILALKARCPFEEYTSVSALEANGAMHTYIVAYLDSPPQLIVDTRDRPCIMRNRICDEVYPCCIRRRSRDRIQT